MPTLLSSSAKSHDDDSSVSSSSSRLRSYADAVVHGSSNNSQPAQQSAPSSSPTSTPTAASTVSRFLGVSSSSNVTTPPTFSSSSSSSLVAPTITPTPTTTKKTKRALIAQKPVQPLTENLVEMYKKSKWLSKHDNTKSVHFPKIKTVKRDSIKSYGDDHKPHRAAHRIVVGARVSKDIGSFIPLQNGQRKRRRSPVGGTVIEEKGKGRWLVSFDNKQTKECSTPQLRLISNDTSNIASRAQENSNMSCANDTRLKAVVVSNKKQQNKQVTSMVNETNVSCDDAVVDDDISSSSSSIAEVIKTIQHPKYKHPEVYDDDDDDDDDAEGTTPLRMYANNNDDVDDDDCNSLSSMPIKDSMILMMMIVMMMILMMPGRMRRRFQLKS